MQGNADILDRLEPGDGVGTLRVDRNLTIRSPGVLSLEIDRDEGGVQHDQLSVAGLADLRRRRCSKSCRAPATRIPRSPATLIDCR